jgi:hypothetical protein
MEQIVYLDGCQGDGTWVRGEQAFQGDSGVGMLKQDVIVLSDCLRPAVSPLYQLHRINEIPKCIRNHHLWRLLS